MEEVFDLRDFLLMLIKKFKLALILGLIFCILGAGYGFFLTGKEETSTYTATSAASVNLIHSEDMPQWSPSNMMSMVDSLAQSDFVYSDFAEFLIKSGYEEFYSDIKTPSILETKDFAKFYSKGNLLLVNIIAPDIETGTKVSELSIEFLAATLSGYLNNIAIVPQGKQTGSVVPTLGDSKLVKAAKFGILGFGGGVALMIIFVFFADIFDLRVKSVADLKKYNIPVLSANSQREA